MTINNLTVTENELKQIESLSMTLLSMVDSYDLPEAVSNVINDLNDEAESLKIRCLMEHHLSLDKEPVQLVSK